MTVRGSLPSTRKESSIASIASMSLGQEEVAARAWDFRSHNGLFEHTAEISACCRQKGKVALFRSACPQFRADAF